MKTIIDVAGAFVLRGFLPYVHISAHKESWKLSLNQGNSSLGILFFTIPHGNLFWSFLIYCPEEWNKWKYSSCQGKVPRMILSTASANTRPQISVMEFMHANEPMPAYIDFSTVGINMVIASSLGGADQKIMEEIKKRMISIMEQEL